MRTQGGRTATAMLPRALDRRLVDLERRLAVIQPTHAIGDDWAGAWIKFTSNDELSELEAIYRAGEPSTVRDKARVVAIEAAAVARLIEHHEGSQR